MNRLVVVGVCALLISGCGSPEDAGEPIGSPVPSASQAPSSDEEELFAPYVVGLTNGSQEIATTLSGSLETWNAAGCSAEMFHRGNRDSACEDQLAKLVDTSAVVSSLWEGLLDPTSPTYAGKLPTGMDYSVEEAQDAVDLMNKEAALLVV